MLLISGIIYLTLIVERSWAFIQPSSTSTKRANILLSARRSTSDRPRRPPPNRNTADRSRTSTPSVTEERKRAPHQFDHTTADARPFLEDPSAYVKEHNSPNEDAPYYKFDNDEDDTTKTLVKEGSHIKSISLDDLFPGINFSEMFCSSAKFRDNIRNSMREDIFDSTPAYEGMSDKARKMLLLPDSSLQGSWNCKRSDDQLRMKKLTKVLKEYLGEDGPTGDHFLQTIGGLCGSKPSTHWIDIVGIKDRKIDHSWHQDSGRSPNGDTYTVLLGFPKEDNYDGIGVFSHSVNLKYERVASDDHPPNEPVLYPGLEIDDKYIVKPRFAKGSEIVMFRDIDTLHSAPDVTYRTSVMRFM